MIFYDTSLPEVSALPLAGTIYPSGDGSFFDPWAKTFEIAFGCLFAKNFLFRREKGLLFLFSAYIFIYGILYNGSHNDLRN